MGLRNVDIVADIDRFRKLAYFQCGIPFPFKNRDVVIYGYGVDLIDDNKVMAVVRSYEPKNVDNWADNTSTFSNYEKVLRGGFNVPPETSKFVRADIKNGGFLLTPIDENTTNISFLFTIDPKMSYLPSSLVNWGMKFVASYALNSLRETANSVHKDEEYINRMEVKADVYDYLKRRLEETNSQKGGNE